MVLGSSPVEVRKVFIGQSDDVYQMMFIRWCLSHDVYHMMFITWCLSDDVYQMFITWCLSDDAYFEDS